MKPVTNCIHFRGDKPCGIYTACTSECPFKKPVEKTILIIKLGALGDVLRTTPILRYLQKKHSGAAVYWLTAPGAVELIHNSLVQEVIPLNWESVTLLRPREFEALYCFDKDPIAIALASDIQARKKYGFVMNTYGKLDTADSHSEYALRLGVDDELKFRTNRLTYQEILFQMAHADFQGEEYVMPDLEGMNIQERLGKQFRAEAGETLIGINIGCGDKFQTKEWGLDSYKKLVALLLEEKGNLRPFILAGPDDRTIYDALVSEFEGTRCLFSGTGNTLTEFMGLVSLCHSVVSNDSLTMHIAIGLKKRVIALFGSTAPWEIELYGRGTSFFSERDCAPCYKKNCSSMVCMQDITPEMVLDAVKRETRKKG